MLFRTRHLVLALILHVVVIAFLVVGVRCSRKVSPPPPIQAAIVDAKPQPAKPEPPKEDPNKKLEEERRRQEEERLKQEQKREQEQRKAEDVARIKAEKKKTEEKKKAEAERKKKEEIARLQQDEKRREQQRLEELQRQMQDEEVQRTQTHNSQARITRQQEWIARITEKVERNWLRPPGVSEDFQCRVGIELLPSGDVVGQPRILQSCGNQLLDDSVIKAILKSSPLPTPTDPADFERSINFVFVPA